MGTRLQKLNEAVRRRFLVARDANDRGSAVLEFLVIGVLVMCPMFYAITTFGRIQAGSYAVAAASRSASRAFVTAPDVGSASARAQSAAGLAFADQGFANAGRVSIACEPGCGERGSTATATARLSVPLPLVPGFLSGVFPTSVTLESVHTDRVARFAEEG